MGKIFGEGMKGSNFIRFRERNGWDAISDRGVIVFRYSQFSSFRVSSWGNGTGLKSRSH